MFRLGRVARWMRGDGNALWALMAAVAAGTLAAPVAIASTGGTIREGVRNPSSGDATRETQVIANTALNTYGTRQSNKGKGGGAIYGCRSRLDAAAPQDPAKSTPCVRVNNLSNGLAFQFAFKGPVGGVIQSGAGFAADDKARPFITNATGVALGLNADRVDGLNAADIIKAARTGAGGAGPAGPAGPEGPAGEKGEKGDKGDPGDGASFSTEKWGVIGRNTLGSPSAEYRVGPYGRSDAQHYKADEPPPMGGGSLGMMVDGPPTAAEPEKLAFGDESDFGDMPVPELETLKYSIFAGVDDLTGVSLPGLAIEIDKDSTNEDPDYTQAVYLPGASSAPSAPDTRAANVWQNYDASAAGSAWKAGGTACSSASPCNFQELKDELGPDAVVSYSLGFSKGRDNAFVGAVDALQVNDDLYDFEPGGVKKTAAP